MYIPYLTSQLNTCWHKVIKSFVPVKPFSTDKGLCLLKFEHETAQGIGIFNVHMHPDALTKQGEGWAQNLLILENLNVKLLEYMNASLSPLPKQLNPEPLQPGSGPYEEK